MRRFALAPVLLLFAGCVNVSWMRTSRFEPVPEVADTELRMGSGLDVCLGRLGAPLWVWEHDGDGVALAYGWFHAKNWNVNVSVPVSRELSASFDYNQIDARMRGLVLFFDSNWRLSAWRRGLLIDITQDARRQRASFDDEAG